MVPALLTVTAPDPADPSISTPERVAERIVALMRMTFEDSRFVDERVGNKPVYLILAMGADKVVRLKPQNLVAGLPLAPAANVA